MEGSFLCLSETVYPMTSLAFSVHSALLGFITIIEDSLCSILVFSLFVVFPLSSPFAYQLSVQDVHITILTD